MNSRRIQIRLSEDTLDRVRDWAYEAHRPPKNQIEFIITQAVAEWENRQQAGAEAEVEEQELKEVEAVSSG
jgi:hypothetical protein